jgi:pSer/pThr/pTyr-binding forkhead associated (FHA) protein
MTEGATEDSQVSEVEEDGMSFSQGETSSISAARFVITSPYTPRPVEIVRGGDEITLGRAGSCDILLDYDTLTSRHHALLKREGEHFVIYDQHSISGVIVNGQKLADDAGQILSDGDHIRIGNYELIFHAHKEEASRMADQADSEAAASSMA